MHKRSFTALVLLALAIRPAWGQAVLAPPIATSPDGQPELPATFAAPVGITQPPETGGEMPSPATPAGPLPRAWQRMEYLLWWVRDTRLPPLITANSSGTVPVLSDASTTVVPGTTSVDNKDRSGGRFTVGFALDSDQTIGVEANYFFLGSRTTTVGTGSTGATGTPALGLSYYDVTTGTEQVQTVAYPNFAGGSATVSASTRMQGAEVNAVANLWYDPCFQLDGLVGFRYLELDEGVQIAYTSDRSSSPPGSASLNLGAADQFDGHNRFYGGQVGLRAEVRQGLFFLSLAGKVALGNSYEVVRINGLSALAQPGQPTRLSQGGTFALPTNSGRFTREEFAVLPEAAVQVGVVLHHNTRLFLGYNLLYLSEVARPADQINRNVNPTQMPLSTRGGPFIGPGQPAFAFQGTDFWAQGLVLGVEYRY
jgi:hypothetical protein